MQIKKILNLLKMCYPNIKPFMKQNIVFIVLTECVVGLTLLIPLIIRFLIDTVLTANHWEQFPSYVICMGAAILFSRLFSITTNILYNRFSANIEAKARDSLFAYVLKKDMTFFNTTGDGEIVDRLMRSPEQLHTIPSIYLERLISSVGTISIVFFILFFINPVMALFSLIAVPIFITVYVKTRSLFFSQIQKAREESGNLTNFYMSTIHNIKQVKNLCSEHDEQNASAEKNQIMKSLSLKYAITGAFVMNGVQIVTQLNQLGVLIYGALLIRNGQMTIGTLIAFYSYLDLLYQPIISIIQALNDMNSSLVGMERYLEYYNHEREEDYECNGNDLIRSSNIDFYNVSFSYGEHRVLEDISFHIEAGEKVILSGKSGIGKSTIVSLMKRFYPCTEGHIEIGNVDINRYDLCALRKNIMYITQEDYFYPTTIRENFVRINHNITDDEMIRILRKAQLYDDIFGPGKSGLDTSLEKNAVTLSGGQRRRMSLAMLFASPAPIVILDEPFVGIDRDTQNKIWLNIKEELQKKTVIMIDHNFSDTDFFQREFEINAHHSIVKNN